MTNAGDGEDGWGFRRDTRRQGTLGVFAQPPTQMRRSETTGLVLRRLDHAERFKSVERTPECVRDPGDGRTSAPGA